jgi:peptidase M42 family hydrolase
MSAEPVSPDGLPAEAGAALPAGLNRFDRGLTLAGLERLKIDMGWVQTVLLDLLAIASPSGRTDHVQQYIGDRLRELGIEFEVTRRGAINAVLEGATLGVDRAVVVHADTIGMLVKALKENGRLEVVPVGTWSARFAEGATVKIFVDDLEHVYTGTVLPLKASGHRYNEEVDTQGVGWTHVEVRVDEPVDTAEGLAALGIQIGDFVAVDALPVVTPSGYVRSRHLDDKAGVAAALGAFKALKESGITLPVSAHLLVTITEEIGHGASHGLDQDVAETVSIDNAVVAPGQTSREDTINITMGDGTGPFDYHLTRRLLSICKSYDLPYRRDLFDHYRSDLAAALEAGAATRTALVGFGVDASHGYERTHLDGLRRLAELITLYLQTTLTFHDWDRNPGDLRDWPTTLVQPGDDLGPR